MAKEKTYRVHARCFVNVMMVVSATSKVEAKEIFKKCPGMWDVTGPWHPHCWEVDTIGKKPTP